MPILPSCPKQPDSGYRHWNTERSPVCWRTNPQKIVTSIFQSRCFVASVNILTRESISGCWLSTVLNLTDFAIGAALIRILRITLLRRLPNLKSGGRFMIAHSESKETINGRHSGQQSGKVSTGPQRCAVRKPFFFCFNVDNCRCTAAFYILSGTKK